MTPSHIACFESTGLSKTLENYTRLSKTSVGILRFDIEQIPNNFNVLGDYKIINVPLWSFDTSNVFPVLSLLPGSKLIIPIGTASDNYTVIMGMWVL